MEDSVHESDMELEDWSEDEFRPRCTIERTVPQERTVPRKIERDKI